MQEFLGYAAARLPRAEWEQRIGLARGDSRGAAASILQKIRDQCIDDDPPQLSAYFVTGAGEGRDGDGGFSCTLSVRPDGLHVNPIFTVTVDSHTRVLLELVAQFFKDQNRSPPPKGGGGVCTPVASETQTGIPVSLGKAQFAATAGAPYGRLRAGAQAPGGSHFDRYPLLGRRADQFEMLKFVCDQLQKGRHREIEGAPETRAIVKFIYA